MAIFLKSIVFLPLLTFLTICLFGRKIGVYGSMLVSCLNIISSWCLAAVLFAVFSFTQVYRVVLWTWLKVTGMPIFFDLRYDSLTAIMFLVVLTVSSCVHVYSCVYMYTDPFLSRFLSYLSLFTFFMLLLVSANNFLVLFMGWEGVGLCSYLLISFWYTRAQAGKSATKAFLINKIGDLFLLSGISLVFIFFHTLDFAVLSILTAFTITDVIEVISCFLFIGAVGKSAQIGLHTWLPDAMEGPTPVSALIHAATMVTAGVFLIIRCSMFFEYAPIMLFVIAIWGGLTALVSGTIGSVQNDIKKIIAYSTCSQLGYMILACGLSLYNISLFHLFNHAFFKALLFLSAGSIIHLMGNEQDIRKMGGIIKLSPFIYTNMLIASFALAGFPFLAGFYSKDFIIETITTQFWVGGSLLYWLAITSAMLTAIYSFRLLEQVFWSNFIGFKIVVYKHIKMTTIEILVLSSLGFLSIISGYFFKDLFIGFGINYFNNIITVLPSTWVIVEVEFLSIEIKLLPLILTLLAVEVESRFFECKWFYNEVINNYLSLPLLFVGRHSFEQYEKLIIESNGPLFFINGIASLLARSFSK